MQALHLILAILTLVFSADSHAASRRFCENHLSRNYDAKVFAVYGLPRTPGSYLVNLSGKRGFLSPGRLAKDLNDIEIIRGQIRTYGSDDTQLRMRAWLGQNSVSQNSKERVTDEQIKNLKKRLLRFLKRATRIASSEIRGSPWLDPDNHSFAGILFFAGRYTEVFESMEEVINRTNMVSFNGRQSQPIKSVLSAMADIYLYGMARYAREPRATGGSPNEKIIEGIARFFMQTAWRPFEPALILRDLRTISIYDKLKVWAASIGLDHYQTLRLARTLAINRTREQEFDQSLTELRHTSGTNSFVTNSVELVHETLLAMPTLDILMEDIEGLLPSSSGTDKKADF